MHKTKTAHPMLDAIEQGRNRIDRDLSPAQQAWVIDLLDVEHHYAVDRLVEIIAAHLPGMAPAIHALAEHATGDPESGCCGLPPRRYGEGDP